MVDTRAGTGQRRLGDRRDRPDGRDPGRQLHCLREGRDGCHARRCSRRAARALSVQWPIAARGVRRSMESLALGRARTLRSPAVGLAAGRRRRRSRRTSNGPIDISADNGTFVNNDLRIDLERRGRGAAGHHPPARRGDHAPSSRRSPAARRSVGAARRPPACRRPQSNCGGTERIEADGDVFYVTPDQIAHGDHAVYTADADQIVMTGNVIVVQGKNVVRGDRLTIQVATREAQMESDAKGRGTPGRVRGVFYPNQPGAPGAAPPAPAADGRPSMAATPRPQPRLAANARRRSGVSCGAPQLPRPARAGRRRSPRGDLSGLVVDRIGKSFGGRQVVKDVSLTPAPRRGRRPARPQRRRQDHLLLHDHRPDRGRLRRDLPRRRGHHRPADVPARPRWASATCRRRPRSSAA